MIFQQVGTGAGSGSIKPLGDNSSMSPKNKYLGLDKNGKAKDDPSALEKLFNRKFSVKHGWKCYIIERSQVAQAGINNVNGTTYSTRPFENRRATTFFALRENMSYQSS